VPAGVATHCTWFAKQVEKGTPSEEQRVRRLKPEAPRCPTSITSAGQAGRQAGQAEEAGAGGAAQQSRGSADQAGELEEQNRHPGRANMPARGAGRLAHTHPAPVLRAWRGPSGLRSGVVYLITRRRVSSVAQAQWRQQQLSCWQPAQAEQRRRLAGWIDGGACC
jgi:hypothetical protein